MWHNENDNIVSEQKDVILSSNAYSDNWYDSYIQNLKICFAHNKN